MIMIVVPSNWVGSQWRLHPLPAADRTVPGSTPSRRRVTQDDPISGRKGVRRHCGRNTGIAVVLMQEEMQERKRTKTSNQDRPKHQTKTPTEPRPHPGNQTPPTTQRERRQKKKKTKKTQERERDLGVGVGDDVRIDGEERVQDEETQGEPQTKKVWGSPAPEREREREHTASTNKPDKKKRGQANISQIRVGS